MWAPEVTALGGYRLFGGDEPDLARRAGVPDADEEYEALDAGTRRAFGLGDPIAEQGEKSDLPDGTWSIRTYDGLRGLKVNVAAAPSSAPADRRADTADTYAWFARHLANLEKGQSLLAVTAAIYVPAQQAAALRMLALQFGVEVETVGVVPGEVLPALAQSFGLSQYLATPSSWLDCAFTMRPPVTGHNRSVSAVAAVVTPDGHTRGTVGRDATVWVWDLTTGEQDGPPLTDHEQVPLPQSTPSTTTRME